MPRGNVNIKGSLVQSGPGANPGNSAAELMRRVTSRMGTFKDSGDAKVTARAASALGIPTKAEVEAEIAARYAPKAKKVASR